jgi:hypothetical protein
MESGRNPLPFAPIFVVVALRMNRYRPFVSLAAVVDRFDSSNCVADCTLHDSEAVSVPGLQNCGIKNAVEMKLRTREYKVVKP